MDQAPVEVSVDIARFKPDGFSVVGQGLVVLLQIVIGQASIVISNGVFRIKFDGLLITFNRLLEIALIKERISGIDISAARCDPAILTRR